MEILASPRRLCHLSAGYTALGTAPETRVDGRGKPGWLPIPEPQRWLAGGETLGALAYRTQHKREGCEDPQ